MASKASTLIRKNRSIQVAVGILGTLLLGALGSGLWELVLRDVLLRMGTFTLTFITSIWGGYVDLLHRDIGKYNRDLLSIPLFAIASAFLLFGPWLLLVRSLRRIANIKENITKDETEEDITPEKAVEELHDIRNKILRWIVPLSIINTLLYAILFWQITYTRGTANWAERSIEILHPYVTNQEYIRLRSDLRAIENAEQFYKLESQLQSFAGKAKVKLPATTIIHKRSGT